MKASIIVLLALLFASSYLYGQHQNRPSVKKLIEFQFMIGQWHGSSTHFSQDGTQQSAVTESVKYALDSTILVIQGSGVDQDGIKQHDALGILYHQDGRYYMHAFTMQGHQVIADVYLQDHKSLNWGFKLANGGQVNYQANFGNNSWKETGTYTTPDGSQTFPTVSMELSKK